MMFEVNERFGIVVVVMETRSSDRRQLERDRIVDIEFEHVANDKRVTDSFGKLRRLKHD